MKCEKNQQVFKDFQKGNKKFSSQIIPFWEKGGKKNGGRTEQRKREGKNKIKSVIAFKEERRKELRVRVTTKEDVCPGGFKDEARRRKIGRKGLLRWENSKGRAR